MKNRNDNKKYILNEYRKKEIKRLFNRLEEIQNKPRSNLAAVKRMFGDTHNHLDKIPKNHTEQRLYQIRRENERLVDKLASTKTTVFSHRLPPPRLNRKFKLLDTMRRKEIEDENKRLGRAIKRASSELKRTS